MIQMDGEFTGAHANPCIFHLLPVRLKLVDAIDLAATNNNSVAKNAPAS
jgi:hypothetical protein